MAAFNWLRFDNACPACGKKSLLKAQFHVASSFDGNETGPFCHRTYVLGKKIVWWPSIDSRWQTWQDGGIPVAENNQAVQECCYTDCEDCGAHLFAVVQFESLAPVSVIALGPEDEWPASFER